MIKVLKSLFIFSYVFVPQWECKISLLIYDQKDSPIK